MLGEFLAFVGGDLARVGHVALVTDANTGVVVRGVLLDFVHPVLDGAEALAVRDVVSHDDTVRALVVAARDRLEALLAGCVPNLKLDGLSVNLNGSNFLHSRTLAHLILNTYEVDTNSRHKIVSENVVL